MEYKYLFERDIERRLEFYSKSIERGEEVKPKKQKSKAKEEPKVNVKSEEFIEPMLAYTASCLRDVLSVHPLVSWEYKLDGMRIIARKKGRKTRLFSRSGNDVTKQFEEIAKGSQKD
jgi:ATP-dependent DNA ligase